jgi:hypothetical protein
MYCRDPSLLARPTRLINLSRRVAHVSLLTCVVLFGAVAATLSLFPSAARMPDAVGYFLVALIGGSGFAWLALLIVFQNGMVKCPCCGGPFAKRRMGVPWLQFPSRCDECGYDVSTGHRDGDF